MTVIIEEARSEGEQLLQKLAARVNEQVGSIPILYVREGKVHEELFNLLEEEPGISILVLGANTGTRGPGPLIGRDPIAGKTGTAQKRCDPGCRPDR